MSYMTWNHNRVRICGLIFAALLASVGLANAEVLVGQVVGVSDGDTITLISADKSQHKIRLAGIDAPEKAQAFGQASKQSLAEMVFNKKVSVLWTKRDRYHRLIGKVLIDDMDVCLEQIKRGMAWHYKKYQNEQSLTDRELYSSTEIKVKNSKLGLWKDVETIPPWEFRRIKN